MKFHSSRGRDERLGVSSQVVSKLWKALLDRINHNCFDNLLSTMELMRYMKDQRPGTRDQGPDVCANKMGGFSTNVIAKRLVSQQQNKTIFRIFH